MDIRPHVSFPAILRLHRRPDFSHTPANEEGQKTAQRNETPMVKARKRHNLMEEKQCISAITSNPTLLLFPEPRGTRRDQFSKAKYILGSYR